MISLGLAIKVGCSLSLATIMVLFAPVVIKQTIHPIPSYQATIPERMAGSEARLSNLESRMDRIEEQKIGEQLAEIKARQEGVLALLAPVALFIFTHTFEIIQRMRGKARTRKTDG